MFEGSLFIGIMAVVIAIIIVILLKMISFIFKLAMFAVLGLGAYYLYGQYPSEVLLGGIVFVGAMIVALILKIIFRKKK